MALDYLIALFCKGEDKRFGGIRCEYYEDTGECKLLTGNKEMRDIFENGRCQPSVMLKDAVERNLDDYRDKIDPKDHIESMAFEISERIKKKCLNCPKLPFLKSYINKAAYTAVIGMLIKEGFLFRRVCGNCGYLSKSRPYVCNRPYIKKEGKRIENPLYGERRELASRACEEGFEPPVPPGPQPPVPPQNEYILLLERIRKLLEERIKNELNENTKRKYMRQHLVFCRFATLLREGYSETKALKAIAKKLGKHVRTIRRDFTEIREFLKDCPLMINNSIL
jgi:hypothetical protein